MTKRRRRPSPDDEQISAKRADYRLLPEPEQISAKRALAQTVQDSASFRRLTVHKRQRSPSQQPEDEEEENNKRRYILPNHPSLEELRKLRVRHFLPGGGRRSMRRRNKSLKAKKGLKDE